MLIEPPSISMEAVYPLAGKRVKVADHCGMMGQHW